MIPEITEEGLKQMWKVIRANKRSIVGFGSGKVPKWSRAAGVMYAHLSMNKGNPKK